MKIILRLILSNFLLVSASAWGGGRPDFFANPICEQADPWITRDHGRYLACFSDRNEGISIQVSDRLTVVGPKHLVWSAPPDGPASAEVWAPELHFLGGHWYVYFAASDGENKNHRAWVLQSAGADPLGPYTLHGPLYTGDDPKLTSLIRWAIDLTVFESRGQLYAIWSGWPDERDLQYLYIAPMKDPMTMAAPRVRLCANDDYYWEHVGESPDGRGLNEAPEVLEHDGKTFVTYSCSGSWQPSYKIGMLELKPGSDPMQPENWTKRPHPAFRSWATTFGVGHNSFVKSPDGTEDWLVYHAKMDRSDGWRRAVFVQRFAWAPDGSPNLGYPVAAGELLPLPSGEHIRATSDARQFQFRTDADLEGWSFFGHHQLIGIENGRLELGGQHGNPVNEFRAGEKVVYNGGRWTNFTASASFSALDSHGQAGLLFRVNTPFLGYNGQRGYFAGLDYDAKKLLLGFTDGKSWHALASAPLTSPLAAEARINVTVKNNEIEVYCEGEPPLHASDNTYKSGSIGLRVVDTHAAFSDVQVSPPP